MDNLQEENLILDTLRTALDYSEKLNKNLKFTMDAKNQVLDTSKESLHEIDTTFDDITKCTLDALRKRRELLKNQVLKIQEEGIAPLNACCDLIKQKLKHTENFMSEGHELLALLKQGQADCDRHLKFLDKSSSLGSLPAVPNLEEVPAITFHLNVDSLQSLLTSTIYSAGVVSKMGPVQITKVEEKPGALLVHWEEVDECGSDEPCYRLQVATGDHGDWRRDSQAVYNEACTTTDTSCLVRDLRLGERYTLRVSCRDVGGHWSAWSLPRVASTGVPHFSWFSHNPHYKTSVEGKIADKVDCEKNVLLSSLKQFGTGNSVEFTVLECPSQCQDYDGVGVVDYFEKSDTLVQKGCIFINAKGSIFVDGVEKTTRLPTLVRGSKISFICEPLTDTRVRLHVESGDKAVTYDWSVTSTLLHFATLCSSPEWKIMVE